MVELLGTKNKIAVGSIQQYLFFLVEFSTEVLFIVTI